MPGAAHVTLEGDRLHLSLQPPDLPALAVEAALGLRDLRPEGVVLRPQRGHRGRERAHPGGGRAAAAAAAAVEPAAVERWRLRALADKLARLRRVGRAQGRRAGRVAPPGCSQLVERRRQGVVGSEAVAASSRGVGTGGVRRSGGGRCREADFYPLARKLARVRLPGCCRWRWRRDARLGPLGGA